MTGTSNSRVSRIIGRITGVLAELDYAQRRLLEIRTGVPMLSQQQRLRTPPSAAELDALYALDDPRMSA